MLQDIQAIMDCKLIHSFSLMNNTSLPDDLKNFYAQFDRDTHGDNDFVTWLSFQQIPKG